RPGSRANAWIVRLADGASSIVRGSTDPMQGWVSFDYGHLLPAPVVDTTASGTHVRFLTLIIPSATSQRSWEVDDLAWHAEGVDLTVTIRGKTRQISVRDGTAWERAA